MRSAYDILRKPRITEKGSVMAESKPVVVFEVPLDANKMEIRKAVQALFNVDVDTVRTMIVRGKIKRRGRHIGKRSNWKKAIVTLGEGQEIDFFGATGA
ncbi:MAG: 50S ribosomal protein L23 [Myxococcota bacterium]